MTYPPQPGQQPYGQQPGAFGHGYPQPYGQYPASGGYPQHGPYAQGGQYPPGAPYGGGFAPQPPKKRTGLWVGIGAAVVVVATFAVAAFVAPGFLLREEQNTTAGGDSDAAGLAQQIAQGFTDHDEAGLNQFVCAGAGPATGGYIEEASVVREFTIQGEVTESGDTATATAHVVVEQRGETVQGGLSLEFANEGGRWCWKDVEQVG
ncbi:hypothetical protein ABZ863_08275 [Saccharomonospora sp. NPDC046836]|uniref:hypothetical protein n=1 Tax=Saccharomonospora sp. NPDC046836 TaxID=3156921 RepID=UPI0033D1ACE1